MTRARMLTLSALGGIALAGGVLVARPDAAQRVPTSDAPRAIDADKLTVVAANSDYEKYWPTTVTIDKASVQIVARQRDPLGGPDWALRTFHRSPLTRGETPRMPEFRDRRRIWCAQLGRIVDGQFTWVRPGSNEAELIGPMVTPFTACATSSPIAQRSGVQIAQLPDRPLDEPGAKPAATVIWGAVAGSPETAEIEHDTASGPVDVTRHGFMKVLPGTTRSGRTLLKVTDSGGERRAAIPGGFWWFSPRTLLNMNRPPAPGTFSSIGRIYQRAEPAGDYVLAGSQHRPGQAPTGIFAKRGAKRPCATNDVPLLADRPAIALEGDAAGLVAETPQPCSPAYRDASKGPVSLGGGWSSGLDDRPVQRREMRRERVELRHEYGSGTMVVAVPSGTTMLEVRSAIGVKVVRVRAERVTFVSWSGQADIGRAGDAREVRKRNGGGRVRTGGEVLLRALDKQGHQIGKTYSSHDR